MATVGMFGALVGYLREAEESKRAMRWLERRVEALSEYVEVLERCVGVGEGGRGYKGATFKASTQKKDQVGCVMGWQAAQRQPRGLEALPVPLTLRPLPPFAPLLRSSAL